MAAKKHRTYAAPPAAQQPLFAATPAPARVTTMTGFSDRAYQLDAVSHIVHRLRGGGRGQLRAACGTGKTKMAKWSADRLVPDGGVVVIAVPTVGLVAQTLAAWAEGDDDHRALAVCSDDSVAADNYGTTEDILEPVTTDSDVVDAWLRMDNTAAVRLIVGTHLSAHVIGAGLQKAGVVADLLVIDEAHRSSGWIGKQTALLHDDEVLPAARRLYMTATPRVWDSSKTTASATYSMDDERIFGPVLYTYPFSRAIDEGYLDDYRLVVIGVTRAEVLAVLRSTERRTGARSRLPDEHTAMVQAATARAAAELGLRRVIAFCPRVADARRFAETFQHTIDALPPQLRPDRPLHAAHVQGSMKQSRRREILEALAQPPHDGWTVIANARCLSEGIDVPTVDGIAFTAPKKSPIDIVQAVGRALRRDPEGSGTATIIVPILLAAEDSGDDEAIEAGSYDVLWQVVRGLRAHDDTLGGALDSHRGGTSTIGSGLERLEFLLPETHRTPRFVEHLTIRLVKSTTSKWWDGYAHLADFHAREGHSRVNHDHVTDDGYPLGDWVSAARLAYKQNRLAPERSDALRRLGFVFDARAADWERGFGVAADFYAEHGHLRPPSRYRRNGVLLAKWLGKQRTAHGRGTLPAERKARLDQIGMQWATVELWQPRLAELRAHHVEHGHLPHPKPYEHLSGAMAKIRAARKRGELTDALIAELDAMGMSWQTPAMDWWDGYRRLADFHAREGHTRVPQSFMTTDNFSLGLWVAATRTLLRKGKLAPDQRQALEALEFTVDPRRETWEHSFTLAAAFYAEHGHLRVPGGLRVDGIHLGQFIRAARSQHAHGTLPADRKARLDQIGMHWEPTTRWDETAAVAEQYAAEHGNLLPPKTWRGPGDVDLHRWLARQRTARANGTLEPERAARLDAAGMQWQPPPARPAPRPRPTLEDRLPQLHAFYAEHRHLPDPHTDAALAAVLKKMRAAHNKGELAAHIVDALGEMGAAWALATDWWDGYDQLAAFHAREGHCRVPTTHVTAGGFDLGAWVSSVRTALRTGNLATDQAEALDKIGFGVDIHTARWEHAFAVATTFAAEHGHLEPARDFRRDEVSLQLWLYQQRKARAANTLDPAREARLTAIGMRWHHKNSHAWDERLAQIRDYHATHGCLPTQTSHPELGRALSRMRTARREGTLAQHIVDALEEMGIVWDTAAAIEASWERGLAAATRFHTLHGHLDVRPSDALHSLDEDEGFDLSGWLKRRRIDRRKGKLTDNQISVLEALNMVWDVHQARWDHSYTACAAFYAEHGHLRVPREYMARNARREEYRLVTWVDRQRQQRGKLTGDQILKLNDIGMDWDRSTSRWENNLAALQRFYDEHGHLNVPADLTNDEGVNLYAVLSICRGSRRRGTLDATRIAALEALGIDWEPGNSGAWDRVLRTLQAYYGEHGNILVPPEFTTDTGTVVADWLTLQRKRYARGELTDAQIAQLNAVGMIWQKRGSRWARSLAVLTAVRDRYGDLNVTYQQAQRDPEARQAYSLLHRYRTDRSHGALPADKIAELTALGIDWRSGSERDWDHAITRLRTYRDTEGSPNDMARTYVDPERFNLGQWLLRARTKAKEGNLSASQVQDLIDCGVRIGTTRPHPGKDKL
ncbi:Helicase associated domain protein [Saccharothrix sp. AJ9571]|nr:Helicase associated domain protein [Saccharothrix sp. AJ9571]